MNKETSIKSLIIAMGIVLALTIAGTFAWLNYRSKSTAMVLTIGDINNIQITLKPYQLDLELSPVLTYTSLDPNEEYITVSVVNNSSTEQKFSLYYDIQEIDNSLVSNDFKYTVLRTNDNNIVTGNFASVNIDEDFYILYNGSIPANTTYNYRVYTWLDGTNNPNIENAMFKADVRASLGEKYYAYFGSADAYFKSSTYTNNILSLSFVNEINIPSGAANWSVGTSPSNVSDVKAWLESDGNGNYSLKIGAASEIYSKNLAYAFNNLYKVQNSDFSSLNTIETKNMSYMLANFSASYFANNSSEVANFSVNFNTSNVTDMSYMFYGAIKMSGWSSPTSLSVNLGNNFDTSKVTNMSNMFSNMGVRGVFGQLNFNLNLGNKFNTANVTNMASMFSNVANGVLNVNLDIGNQFNTSKVTNMDYMFANTAYNTQNNFALDLSLANFNAVTSSTNMFYGFPTNYSTVYVKDGAAQNFVISKNSGFSASNVLIK
ncbi:MAG: BspA family leucine-rich repeat surface protein [Bacilli bacterium]|nr:BspA family leucine-rich repeat surface protein [Bacilli bacterium]